MSHFQRRQKQSRIQVFENEFWISGKKWILNFLQLCHSERSLVLLVWHPQCLPKFHHCLLLLHYWSLEFVWLFLFEVHCDRKSLVADRPGRLDHYQADHISLKEKLSEISEFNEGIKKNLTIEKLRTWYWKCSRMNFCTVQANTVYLFLILNRESFQKFLRLESF